MQKTFLDYSKTDILPPLALDYLNNEKPLDEFYAYRPDINDFEKAILQKKKEKINRKLLVDVLNTQYKNIYAGNFEFSNRVREHINLLSDENTFTVTTGHQLNIFTGPLYFIYKIFSTINLSERLKKHYPQYNFVPVYWMASEDHDFDEINHAHLYGKTITWKQDEKGACGRIDTASINDSLNELKNTIGESAEAKTILSILETAYLPGKKLADAMRILVYQLFSKYGLVIIDGDDKQLKKEFSSVMQDDLLHNTAFQLVNNTIQKLKATYKVQVNPREINLFYLKDGLRERIEKSDSQFTIHNSPLKFSEQEIINELKNNPENFSPNVVLRPLYQEKILPGIAYVGGPGEISYWLEYKAMFDHYKVNFPVLMIRNSFLLLEESSVAKMNKLNVALEDFFQSEDELVKSFVKKNMDGAISLQSEASEIKNLFERVKQKADASDASLLASIEGEKHKTVKAFENLEAKLLRAEKRKSEVEINRLKKIREKIFPGGDLQERYDNFIPYYIRYGEKFFALLKEHADPFLGKCMVLSFQDTGE